jgi:hypothetical protein
MKVMVNKTVYVPVEVSFTVNVVGCKTEVDSFVVQECSVNEEYVSAKLNNDMVFAEELAQEAREEAYSE